MARRKNPRTLLTQRTKDLKLAAEQITRWMTIHAARTVYIPMEDRTEPGVWQRPRRPKEHVDNRPELWLSAREELVVMASLVREADVLMRYKLAELGYDARGVRIGRRAALERLDAADVANLVRLGVVPDGWDATEED